MERTQRCNSMYWGVLRCLCLAVALILGACEKNLDIDLGENSGRPVLYAFFQPDSALAIGLSKSVSILSSSDYEYFQDAAVSVYRNGQFSNRLSYPNDRLNAAWEQVKFGHGDTIRLEISALGVDKVTAESVIPLDVPIEKIDTLRVYRKQANGAYAAMMKTQVVFADKGGQSDFYQLQMFRVTDTLNAANEIVSVFDTLDFVKDDLVFYDPDQGVSSFESIDFQGLFNDTKIDGKRYALTVYLDVKLFGHVKPVVGSRLVCRLYHIDAVYYDFMRAMIISRSYDGLPVYNQVKIPSNVENGYGIVAGLSCSEIVLEAK